MTTKKKTHPNGLALITLTPPAWAPAAMAIALALGGVMHPAPVRAAENSEVLEQLRRMNDRIQQLEKRNQELERQIGELSRSTGGSSVSNSAARPGEGRLERLERQNLELQRQLNDLVQTPL